MFCSVIKKKLGGSPSLKRWKTKILSPQEALLRLGRKKDDYLAFYSSVLQGIVKDPRFMTLPIDDHLVHRGHGVFDTAIVKDGKVYQLDQHLDRFERSAKGCRLWKQDSFFDKRNLKGIILDTIRAGAKRDQLVRYWLGAGPGDFEISSKGCEFPSFYVISQKYKELKPMVYEEGVKMITSTIPMKPKPFSNIKTTNYLPNVLTALEAEDNGAYTGAWIDSDGLVAECPTTNIGFIQHGKMLVPTFDKTLAGISVQRMMRLAKTQLNLEVHQQDIHISQAKKCEEVFLFGGNLGCVPVIQWDDEKIGSGKVGPISRQLRAVFVEDRRLGHNDEQQLIGIDELE